MLASRESVTCSTSGPAGRSCLSLVDDGVPNLPSFVAPAAAVVGRPLTPVSYAGVARRTARRCNGGAYNC